MADTGCIALEEVTTYLIERLAHTMYETRGILIILANGWLIGSDWFRVRLKVSPFSHLSGDKLLRGNIINRTKYFL